MILDDLIRESHQTAVDKGWWEKERNFGEQIALMHSELSEVLEEYRKEGLNHLLYEVSGKPEGIAAELADLLIRVFDTCGKYNIPIQEALRIKMSYNKSRPYRHGGKLA